MAELVLSSLPDSKIIEYSGDRIIATHMDFNLKKSIMSDDGESFTLHPIPKGIYDPRYFGSLYNHSCNCGRVKRIGITCDLCGSMLMTDEMAYNRFARIDMGIYHSSTLKLNLLMRYLKNSYNLVLDYDDTKPLLPFIIEKGEGEYTLDIAEGLYLAKITHDKDSNSLIFSNNITNPKDTGLDAIVEILSNDGKDWERFINRFIIVSPARMRPVSIRTNGTQKVIGVPESSQCYTALAYLANDLSHLYSQYFAKGSRATEEDTYQLVIKKASVLHCVRATEMKLSALSASSKDNIARSSYRIRQANSGRSVITGDPHLKIDEVGLPIALAYEALKTDFIRHVRDELRIKRSEAVERYMEPDQQIKDMFKQYAESRTVLLNRAPTLFKYNLMSFKIRLVEDSSIHLPIEVTSAFNADFDGDTMAYFLVPEDIQDYVEDIMSPRNIKVFEKDDSYQFTPKHEVMNGVIILTKIVKPEKVVTVDSLDTAREMIDNNELEIYTTINYKGRETTWGRERVSEIIGSHLDHVTGPNVAITSKNIGEVYAIINKYSPEKRVDIIKELQDEALYWVTEYGISTPTLKELSSAADDEFKPMVDEILKSDEYDDKDKFLKAKKLYDSRVKVIEDKHPQLVEKLNESNRAKVFQLMEMSVPQFLINDQGELVISDKPLVEGLTEREYVTHSYNNRALLNIKALSVPAGGYLTRQLVFLCQGIVINVDEDPENHGIELPRYRCYGRTTIDGEILGQTFTKNVNDKVRVRSVVQSKQGVVSTDMFSTKYGFNTEKNRVGISLASSFTESLTQSLLGLKHG